MKTYIVIAGILLSLLSGLLLVPATSAYTGPIAAIALVLSLLILTLSLLGGSKSRTTPVPGSDGASPYQSAVPAGDLAIEPGDRLQSPPAPDSRGFGIGRRSQRRACRFGSPAGVAERFARFAVVS